MRFNLQRGGFFIDGGTPFNPPQAQTMPSHYDHPARIMEAESQIASLKSALREALDAWQVRCKWVDDGITDNVPINDERNRITELRKQFLGPTK